MTPQDAPSFREARRDDLPVLVRMLADDALGAARERVEDPLPPAYLDAFEAIARSGATRLIVAERAGEVVGALQLTILPGLSMVGATRAEIEGVRVASHCRGQGIGEAMLRHVIALAREAGCAVMQLSSSRSRVDAQRFYARLGFAASHVGMKLRLDAD